MQANNPSKQRSVRMGASVVRRVGFPTRRGNNAITSFSLSPRTACWPTFVPRALIGYSVLRQFSKISEWPKWLCNCQMQKIHLTSNSISHFEAEGKKGYKLCKETRASENNGNGRRNDLNGWLKPQGLRYLSILLRMTLRCNFCLVLKIGQNVRHFRQN